MEYKWREAVGKELEGTAEQIDALDNLVSEMSPKEWRVFQGGGAIHGLGDIPEALALIRHLPKFEYIYPVVNHSDLGLYLARHKHSIPEKDIEFLDCAKMGKDHIDQDKGVIVDGAYISPLHPSIQLWVESDAASIRRGERIPVDKSWVARFRIEAPNGRDCWIRLPDMEISTRKADEIATALDDLGGYDIGNCNLLEAKCALPGIDIMSQYDDNLRELAVAASNLGAVYDEHFEEKNFLAKLVSALQYEKCDRLDFAADIICNLDCYDFYSDEDLHELGKELVHLDTGGKNEVSEYFDYAARASTHLLTLGMESEGAMKVEGGYFARNKKEFTFEYSLPEEERQAEQHRLQLEYNLNERLQDDYSAYTSEIQGLSKLEIFNSAEEIAATNALFEAFYDNSGYLSDEAIEQLLGFESPLAVLGDIWSEANPYVNVANEVATHLEDKLGDPSAFSGYNLVDEFSDEPAATVQDQDFS